MHHHHMRGRNPVLPRLPNVQHILPQHHGTGLAQREVVAVSQSSRPQLGHSLLSIRFGSRHKQPVRLIVLLCRSMEASCMICVAALSLSLPYFRASHCTMFTVTGVLRAWRLCRAAWVLLMPLGLHGTCMPALCPTPHSSGICVHVPAGRLDIMWGWHS